MNPDMVIRGGLVVDGTGTPPSRADVAISGGRITDVGEVPRDDAIEIDVVGAAVAPGFIDVHTHDDRAVLESDMAPKVSQGVTTVIVGNCGVSLAPLTLDRAPPPPLDLIGERDDFRFPRFRDFIAALEARPPTVNVACLVGHSALRVGCMADLDRPANVREIEVMRSRLSAALEAGAIGLSTGLFYAPASAAPQDEVVALARLLHPARAIYTTHLRDEAEHVMDSLSEAFAVGQLAAVPVIISHHKAMGRANFGRTRETLAFIKDAMSRQTIGLDVYPYVASSTVLQTLLVSRANKVLITWSKSHPEVAGRYVTEIASSWRVSQEEVCTRIQPAGAIYWSMDEADVQRVLAFEHTMVGSDGLPHDLHPHPRLWGTFPRVLGRYSRELKLFQLQEAVRRMTGLPAERFGLINRGRVVPGAYADLCVFDPATVTDLATFEQPTTPAAGISFVLVNGEVVWQHGASTGARPGRTLRRQAMRAERAVELAPASRAVTLKSGG
jgi:N-acyl-D-amino-acid deacylase